MSAAKMVADSTQGDMPELSGTKKRKKTVQKKKAKKAKEKESSKKTKKKSQEQEFDEGDLDLEKEIHPISVYVKDREELLDQMFHCVKGQSLERALPNVLQSIPFDDLKQRCLQQLLVMSKKRIRRILGGDDPATISSSGTEDDTSEEEIQEMEEVNEDNEAEMVDSTSLYGQATDDSDRHDDDDDVDSLVHSSVSPYCSDREQDYQDHYEDDSDQDEGSVNEGYEADNPETVKKYLTKVRVIEDPEEGEVFDDSDDNEPVYERKTANVVSENIDEEQANEYGDEETNDGSEMKVTEGETVNAALNNVIGEDAVIIIDPNKDDKGQSDNVVDDAQTEDVVMDSKIEEVEITSEDKEETVNISADERVGRKVKLSENDKNKPGMTDKCCGISNKRNDDIELKASELGHTGVEQNVSIVEENEAEIAIEDDNDDEFIDENVASGQSDGEINDEENDESEESIDKRVTESKSSEGAEGPKPPRRIVKPPSQEIAPALTKNQMELLELEMRARAIKAMLKTAK